MKEAMGQIGKRSSPVRPAKDLPGWFCGYIAGMIDADGHVKAHPRILSISNTDLECLEFLRQYVGGHISTAGAIRSGQNKQGYQLCLRNEEIVALLPQIIKYMIIKREEAENLLEALIGRLYIKQYRETDMTAEIILENVYFMCNHLTNEKRMV